MARTYASSVTFYCANDCGTEVTYRRDDFLPTGDWVCDACQLEALDAYMQTEEARVDRDIAEMNALAKMEADATTTPMPPEKVARILRAAFPDRIKRISDFN